MTERSQNFMSKIWELRNAGADTEEKLVAAILKVVAENTKSYTAQDNLIVLDKNDILELAEELKMTKLTQEQLQTIEDAFNSIPEPMRTGKFGTMEGIEEQLAEGSTLIFYTTKAEITNSNGLTQANYVIDKMRVV